MTELPVNCLFDKTITGCGGTELALTNEKHTIIAMPFVSLVENKVMQEQHKGKVLGVFNGIINCDIQEYIKTHEIWKIACTYDALPRVVSVIEDMGIDVYNEFFALVDEWHVLFNQYAFREKAITQLLKIAQLFAEVTYMTATPIEDELILKEVKHLPVVKLN